MIWESVFIDAEREKKTESNKRKTFGGTNFVDCSHRLLSINRVNPSICLHYRTKHEVPPFEVFLLDLVESMYYSCTIKFDLESPPTHFPVRTALCHFTIVIANFNSFKCHNWISCSIEFFCLNSVFNAISSIVQRRVERISTC